MTPATDILSDWIAPGRCALLIVDLQTDFAAEDGAMGKAGVDLSAIPAALRSVEDLVRAARARGVSVFFLRLGTEPATDSPVWTERLRRLGQAPADLCRIGAHGALGVGPSPRAGEIVINKTRYGGFFGTDLDARLRAAGIDTLVLCGLTTECCVDWTAREAFQLDYHVFIARDACAAYEADLHEAALKALALNCAIILDSKAAMAAWGDDEAGRPGQLLDASCAQDAVSP